MPRQWYPIDLQVFYSFVMNGSVDRVALLRLGARPVDLCACQADSPASVYFDTTLMERSFDVLDRRSASPWDRNRIDELEEDVSRRATLSWRGCRP